MREERSSAGAADRNGQELAIGDTIRTLHPDTHEEITVTIRGTDFDEERDAWMIDYTTADGEDKWEYADCTTKISS